jgi:hypothetical protein
MRPPPTAVGTAMLDRECGAVYAAAVAGAAAMGWFAATVVTGPASADGVAGMTMRLIRRFDLTLLAAAVILAGVRVTVRIDEDRRAGWLEPWCAAGGSRMAYSVGLMLAAALSAWLLFAVGAASFGTGVLLLAGNHELLHGWTRLAPAGLLLIAIATAHVAAVGTMVREPLVALCCAALLAAAPYAAAAVFLARHGFTPAPLPLWIWIQAALPVTVAASPPDVLRQALYLTVATGVVLLAGARGVGRRV